MSADTIVSQGHQSDDHLANSKDHEAAMAVYAMTSAIIDLCKMANDSVGSEFVRQNIDNLERNYAGLGQLLLTMHMRQEAAE